MVECIAMKLANQRPRNDFKCMEAKLKLSQFIGFSPYTKKDADFHCISCIKHNTIFLNYFNFSSFGVSYYYMASVIYGHPLHIRHGKIEVLPTMEELGTRKERESAS